MWVVALVILRTLENCLVSRFVFYNFKIFVHYLRKEVKFTQIKPQGACDRLSLSGSKLRYWSSKVLVIDRKLRIYEKENVIKSIALYWTIDDTGIQVSRKRQQLRSKSISHFQFLGFYAPPPPSLTKKLNIFKPVQHMTAELSYMYFKCMVTLKLPQQQSFDSYGFQNMLLPGHLSLFYFKTTLIVNAFPSSFSQLTKFTQMNVWTHYVFWDGEYPNITASSQHKS